MTRKIDAMHERFGKAEGTCWDCDNLVCQFYSDKGRRAYKCRIYGISACEATDWKVSSQACGMKNRKAPAGTEPIVRQLVRERAKQRRNPDEPNENQVSFEFEEEWRGVCSDTIGGDDE